MVSATSIAAVLVGGFGAVLLYALLRANPPESCIGCGKEFEVNEEVHPPEAVGWSPEVSARLRKERSELGLYLFECDTTTKLLTGKAVTWDQVCSLEDPNAKREPWFDEATARLIFVYSTIRAARATWKHSDSSKQKGGGND